MVFVGDAAHAMLPTAGQGAATALEDGVCVGRMIAAPVAAGGDQAAALAAFDRARRPRCRQIARTAILTARFGCDLGGGWRQPVRNAIFRRLPAGSLVKAGAVDRALDGSLVSPAARGNGRLRVAGVRSI